MLVLASILKSNEIICSLTNKLVLIQIYIYAVISFVTGFTAALVICLVQWIKIKKNQKSLEGFLESEKLIKERFQKENNGLHGIKEAAQKEHGLKIAELQALVKVMDEDILLLQKSNEETEALLAAGDPVAHTLKLKLIEANNTIARYKAQMMVK